MTEFQLSRRGFLKGVVAATAVSSFGVNLNNFLAEPILYADGIGDDTDAIQALFDGKPFICQGQAVARSEKGFVELGNATLRITRTITFPSDAAVNLHHCRINAFLAGGNPVIFWAPGKTPHISITHNTIEIRAV